jgi:hypothetical protein
MKNKNLTNKSFNISIYPNRFVWNHEAPPPKQEVPTAKPETDREIQAEIARRVHDLEEGKKEKKLICETLAALMILKPKLFSPELLTALSHRTEEPIIWGVSQNPNTPPAVLTKLARHPDVEIRRNVKLNPSTPASVRERIAL